MALGVVLGAGVIVGTQYPLAYAHARGSIDRSALTVDPARRGTVDFPDAGSGAVAIPDLHVFLQSTHQDPVPIASLTKLMTAYLVLRYLPLSMGASGPCLVVTSDDVAAYLFDLSADQSVVKVAAGSVLCESDLLNGLFVHSANNYAEMLVRMVGYDDHTFVGIMNRTARQLAMYDTTYADVSGIDNSSVSTSVDQLRLVTLLMKSALIQSIVRQTSVTLPVAGVVHTFTPLLGTLGVVGIKSGRTDAAGGCDAMALATTRGNRSFLTYSVVLAQRGPNLLAAAGAAAYALAHSAAELVVSRTWAEGSIAGSFGWSGSSTTIAVTSTTTELWWMRAPIVHVVWDSFGGHIGAGTVVGVLATAPCEFCSLAPIVALRTERDVERPPWYNGLR